MKIISYCGFCSSEASLIPTYSASFSNCGSFFSISSTSCAISFLKLLRLSPTSTLCFSSVNTSSIVGSVVNYEGKASS